MTHDREERKGNSKGNNVNSAIGLDVAELRNDGWVSVENSNPTISPDEYGEIKYVLVTDGKTVEMGGFGEIDASDINKYWIDDRGMLTPFKATHWQPLPAPPKAD
jgi:hypothetical protein